MFLGPVVVVLWVRVSELGSESLLCGSHMGKILWTQQPHKVILAKPVGLHFLTMSSSILCLLPSILGPAGFLHLMVAVSVSHDLSSYTYMSAAPLPFSEK